MSKTYELPIELNVDYMQSDLHIVHVSITNIFEDMLYIMCSIHTESGSVYPGVCYWYTGTNKDIPFEWSPA